MKVTCQSCQAKYTIADEKVRGKVAKIRCKKCGTTIIVNATGASQSIPPSQSGAPAAQSAPPPAADYAHAEPSAEVWSVLIADGDQRQLTAPQIDELYRQGTVGYDTYVWKDGMGDWLQIAAVEPLKAFLDRGSKPAIATPAHDPPAWSPPAATEPTPAPSPAPIAARAETGRRPGRGASTDLFGAGAADDVMTSAPINPVVHEPGSADKPTGARNENSVLFSLASLSGARPDAQAPGADAAPPSARADLNALVSSGGNGAKKSAGRIDDIMNLGGGGIYAPGLASPALAPPPVDFPASSAGSELSGVAYPRQDNKKMFLAFGAGIVVVGAVVLAMQLFGGDKTADATKDKPASNEVAAATSTPQRAPSPAPTGTAPAEPPSTASATAESAPTALAPGQIEPPKEKEPAKVAVKPTTHKEEKEPAAAEPKAASPVAVAKPVAAAAPAAPAGGPAAAFDRAAALSTLSRAASAAQSCKRADGPTGSGRIAVTFAPSGNATTATVEGPPFAGTSVGGCVAARFRGTRVPAFGGGPVTVHKTFFIN
jgi:predicted Zn finger-like uncharacterized protein